MVVTHTYTLHLTHPSAHTHPEQWAANAAAPREQLGALLQESHLSRGIEGGESAVIHSPTYNPCRTWDLNPQPSGNKSDSLSIRPRTAYNLTALFETIISHNLLNNCLANVAKMF